MPTKKNFLGGNQNYNPKNGEYEPSLVGKNGKNGKVVKDADGDGIAHEGWDFDEETQNYTNKDGEVFSKGEYENKYKIGQSDETVLNNAIWDLERQGKEINADNVINAINDDFSGYIGTKEKEDAFREYADKKAKVDITDSDLEGIVEAFAAKNYPDQSPMLKILNKANASKSKMNVTKLK